MQPNAFPRLKICCIGSVEEARLALRYGAAAIGLVSEMPSGPGPIPEGRIADIVAALPPGTVSVLLTSKRDPELIVAQWRRTGVSAIQLVDRMDRSAYRVLRDALPGIMLIQVVHVRGRGAIGEALGLAAVVDAVLLDSGNPDLPVKELGGTGRVHDWTLSAEIRDLLPIPVFLAGGLTAGNVAAAVRGVGPSYLDVCSGVRTSGRLDEAKLSAFAAAAGVGGGRSHGGG